LFLHQQSEKYCIAFHSSFLRTKLLHNFRFFLRWACGFRKNRKIICAANLQAATLAFFDCHARYKCIVMSGSIAALK